jgi:DNA-binding beta-propeller fold protein YncE
LFTSQILAALLILAEAPASGELTALVVVNQPNRTLQMVDISTGRVQRSTAMGERPHELEVSPDQKYAVAPIYGSGAVGRPGTDGSTIEVVNVATGALEKIDLGAGMRPHDARFGSDGMLYVTAELREAVLVIDIKSRAVVAEIPTGSPQSHSLALSPDGRRGYTANVGSGSVSILDLTARKLEGVITAAAVVQRVTAAPDGQRVYTHDQRQPRVIAIDPDARIITETYELPGLPYVSAATADNKRLIIGGRPELEGKPQRPPSLYILDFATKQVATVELPGWPRTIVLDEAAQIAWANLGSGEIVGINLQDKSFRVLARLERGLDGMSAVRLRQ